MEASEISDPPIEDVVYLAVRLFDASNGVKVYDWDDWEEFHQGARAYEAADAVRDALEKLRVDLPKEPLSGWIEGGIVIDDSWPEAEELVIERIPDYEERLAKHVEAAKQLERQYGPLR